MTYLCTMPKEWRYVIPEAMSIRLSRVVPCNGMPHEVTSGLLAGDLLCAFWSLSDPRDDISLMQ